MLRRRPWRQSPRVMGRGAVLGWGCGKLAPLPLRGSSRAALPGRSAGAPAREHLNPAAPGALTLRGGGTKEQRCFGEFPGTTSREVCGLGAREWILKVGP